MPNRRYIASGTRFGRLRFAERTEPIDGKPYARFVCDCGTKKTIRLHHVTSGRVVSCGCWKDENTSRRFKGRPGKINPESHFERVYRGTARAARKRGYSFNLSKDEVKKLHNTPCFYCGELASNAQLPYGRSNKSIYRYNGIDRVNNAIGYEPGNCVTCCKRCNVAKHTMTQEQFIGLCRRIVDHQEITSFVRLVA